MTEGQERRIKERRFEHPALETYATFIAPLQAEIESLQKDNAALMKRNDEILAALAKAVGLMGKRTAIDANLHRIMEDMEDIVKKIKAGEQK